MIKCPKCGTEYTVLPDVCAQCGMHFEPEDGIPDLFAAALRQERHIRAQQQTQREIYLKLREEKNAEKKAAREESSEQEETAPDFSESLLPETEEDAPEQSAQIPPTRSSHPQAKQQTKKPAKVWWILVAAAFLGLVGYTGFSLRNGFLEQAPDGSFAFYRQDNTLWFYREDTGEKLRLTPNGKPVDALPDDYYEKLTQISADGSRIYYPTDFASSNRCRIASRSLKDPSEPELLAEIMMFPDVQPGTIQLEDGTVNILEDDTLVDMLPPYILDGDTLFYINPDGALCRMQYGAEEEILSESPVRYWHVTGREGICFLEMTEISGEGLFLPERIDSSPTPWSITESAPHPCRVLLCGATGEPEVPSYPFGERTIQRWAIPYANSDNYFYCNSITDNEMSLIQIDMRQNASDMMTPAHQCLTDIITTETWFENEEASLPLLFCAYPDGSFYYGVYSIPMHSSDGNITVLFFDRKQAAAKVIYTFGDDIEISFLDICRTAPYMAFGFSTIEQPYVYYKSQSVSLDIPHTGNAYHPQILTFDTRYPVLYTKSDPDVFIVRSTSDSLLDVTAEPEEKEDPLYYAILNKAEQLQFQPLEHIIENGEYFAYQPEGAAQPEQFCWVQDSGDLMLPQSSAGQIDKITHQYGSLFCHSDADSSIFLYRDGSLQKLTGSGFDTDKWMPASSDTIYAVNQSRELVLCKPDMQQVVDTADLICCTGEMPKKDDPAKEDSE